MIIKTSKGNRKRSTLYSPADIYSRVKRLKIENQYSMNEKYNFLISKSLKMLEEAEETKIKSERKF